MAKGGGGAQGGGLNALTAGSAKPPIQTTPASTTGAVGPPPTNAPGGAGLVNGLTPQETALMHGMQQDIDFANSRTGPGNAALRRSAAANAPQLAMLRNKMFDSMLGGGAPQGIVTTPASKTGKVAPLPEGTRTVGSIDPSSLRQVMAMMMAGNRGGGYGSQGYGKMSKS